MKLANAVKVVGLLLVATIATAAARPDHASVNSTTPMAAASYENDLLSDCFGCYPGGLGVPVICDFGEHHDQEGSSEFFGPRSEMHTGCSTEECSDHGECEPSQETIDALVEAVAARDVGQPHRLMSDDEKIEFNQERSAIQLLDCRGQNVVLHLILEESVAQALR